MLIDPETPQPHGTQRCPDPTESDKTTERCSETPQMGLLAGAATAMLSAAVPCGGRRSCSLLCSLVQLVCCSTASQTSNVFPLQNLAVALQNRMSEVLHVDIHPGAKIGRGMLIDHATGVVRPSAHDVLLVYPGR